ncbi:MAG TPA: phosphopantothenoylcysteine decarboxylase [Candidatus Limnocylindria bacterium]|jgi:phosphopantothenoylcysteine synthetase/decarboxylase|nr:phosphopantothenoylcysteine decarboxylase [Candidatus Limnocylindria bacterium]
MRCLVSAGPTYEPLDRVRRLTNFSTGSLGTELANRLASAGHDVQLLRGEEAQSQPPVAAVSVEPFSTTSDLAARFLAHATHERIAIFHAAAVSDFAFGLVYERNEEGDLSPIYQGKLNTRQGSLFAELKPTPKIIRGLREWFANALIVGWKYEVDGTRDDALGKGQRQLSECQSDWCVVNGPAYGAGFGLLSPHSPPQHLSSRPELYNRLLALLTA